MTPRRLCSEPEKEAMKRDHHDHIILIVSTTSDSGVGPKGPKQLALPNCGAFRHQSIGRYRKSWYLASYLHIGDDLLIQAPKGRAILLRSTLHGVLKTRER